MTEQEEVARALVGANNTKHPPSEHAMEVLDRVAYETFPQQEMNFTVRNKLRAFGYITLKDYPSPYKTHKEGRTVPFAVITPKGRKALNIWKQER